MYTENELGRLLEIASEKINCKDILKITAS